MHLQLLTRDQIQDRAPTGTVVLPTASIEQHGPHLPINVDTVLCTQVAELAIDRAEAEVNSGSICLAPTQSWGNSHHHRPYPGVLSLTSDNYMATITDILEGLYLAGFRRLFILNGHGGNTAPNQIVTQDFVNRRGFGAHVTAADYWNIARNALQASGLIEGARIPGHAGEFETALMLAVRPASLSELGMNLVKGRPDTGKPIYGSLPTKVETKGSWLAQGGYSDEPDKGTPSQGKQMLEVIVTEVTNALLAFHKLPAMG